MLMVAIVLNDRISCRAAVQLHPDHARVGRARRSEVDRAVVNQSCVFIPFHRNSVITANIHGAVILRNVIAVNEFHCNAAVFIKIDDPIALVPEEGIAAPGITALTAKDFAVTSAIPPLIKRPFPPQKFSTPLWEELDSNIFPVL